MVWIQNLDWSVLHWVHATFQGPFLDFLMPKLSLLGDVGGIWVAAGVLLICTKKYRRQGFLVLGSILLCFCIGNLCLKPLVARPRPCWLETNIPLLVKNPTDFSFPSGHTLASAAGATVLTLTNRKFGWVAIPLALLIAFSRLYLYVHFPTDVLAGLILGFLIGAFTFWAGGKLPGQRLAACRERP